MGAKIVKYKAKDGFRWKLVAVNGRIIADSGEAYTTKSSIRRAVDTVLSVFESPVEVEEDLE